LLGLVKVDATVEARTSSSWKSLSPLSTPWGYAFDDHAWSPEGSWIVFQRPYGQLYLVRPDGSDLHRVPLDLPPNTGALNPSWSPDGTWIVFSLQRSDQAEIYMARPNGTGLRKVTGAPDVQGQHPDWEATSD
jgi:Tol biopolymer transport system component